MIARSLKLAKTISSINAQASNFGHRLGEFLPHDPMLKAKCAACEASVCVAVLGPQDGREMVVYDGSAVAHRCPYTKAAS